MVIVLAGPVSRMKAPGAKAEKEADNSHSALACQAIVASASLPMKRASLSLGARIRLPGMS